MKYYRLILLFLLLATVVASNNGPGHRRVFSQGRPTIETIYSSSPIRIISEPSSAGLVQPSASSSVPGSAGLAQPSSAQASASSVQPSASSSFSQRVPGAPVPHHTSVAVNHMAPRKAPVKSIPPFMTAPSHTQPSFSIGTSITSQGVGVLGMNFSIPLGKLPKDKQNEKEDLRNHIDFLNRHISAGRKDLIPYMERSLATLISKY